MEVLAMSIMARVGARRSVRIADQVYTSSDGLAQVLPELMIEPEASTGQRVARTPWSELKQAAEKGRDVNAR